MFIKKDRYYIYLENLRSINTDSIKQGNKFNFIYRNHEKDQDIEYLIKFSKLCKKKNIKFFIYNDVSFALKINASGIYLPAHNKNYLKIGTNLRKKLDIIGSAHNFKEIDQKKRQGCESILLSRIFKTDYKNKKSFYGPVKFNLITRNYKTNFIALGGIRSENIKVLRIVNCKGIAFLSEAKKKPAIIRRLF